MTRIALIAALGVGLLGAVTGAQARSYKVTDITAPGTPVGDYAYASGVNNLGQVLVVAVNPLVGDTFVDVADVYDSHTHTFTAFPAAPGAQPLSTLPQGLNGSGTVVGSYSPPGGGFRGFSVQGGTFSSVDPLGSLDTEAVGVSNSGEVVGYVGSRAYFDIGGVFTLIATGSPASSADLAVGVNDAGVIDGKSIDSSGGVTSFLDTGGVITSIVDPGQSATDVGGLNDFGEIVGGAGDQVGFNYTSSFIDDHGLFTTLVIPGAIASYAVGIDDLGDVVGSYTDAAGATHAFLATPVTEPATWAMMFIGMWGIGVSLRGRRHGPKPPLNPRRRRHAISRRVAHLA